MYLASPLFVGRDPNQRHTDIRETQVWQITFLLALPAIPLSDCWSFAPLTLWKT